MTIFYIPNPTQYLNLQSDLTAIRTYFTRWLIRTNLYDLTRTNS